MRKIKITALLLTLVILAGMFSGCGNNAKKQDGVTEIVMWSADTHAREFMTKKVKEFNETIGKENNVRFVIEYKETGREMDIALQNGTEPDFVTGTSREYYEKGYIVPLTDVPGIEEVVEKNSQIMYEGINVFDGKLYALGITSQVYGLAYNKDLFKAAGIVDENGEAKAPETLDEMVEAARKITDKSKKQYGMIVPVKWGTWYALEIATPSKAISGFTNGSYNPRTGLYDYNGIKPMASAILKMKDEGLLYPGSEGLDNDPARARFAEGNVGMKMCVTWDVGVWNDQFKADFDWGIAPVPTVNKGDNYYHAKDPGYSYGISKRRLEEKGPEAIALVFNWLYSDEMLIEQCSEGLYMPFRADIAEKSSTNEERKGWSDFVEIVKISDVQPFTMPTDKSAYESDGVDFVNKVWYGVMSLEDWIAERNKISNDGIELYKKVHPDKDYSDRRIPDYNPHYE